MFSKKVMVRFQDFTHASAVIKEARKRRIRYTEVKYPHEYKIQMKQQDYQEIKNTLFERDGLAISEI